MAGEKNLPEEVDDSTSDDSSASDPPDDSKMAVDDNDEDDDEDEDEESEMEHNGPDHERCVHGEINAVCCNLNVRYNVEQPDDLWMLRKYFHHEWSEAEHLFRWALDYEEDLRGYWSPCPSPTPTSLGL